MSKKPKALPPPPPSYPPGPRKWKKCARCGGALEMTAEEKRPDGTAIERNKRCTVCQLDHLETEQL